MKSTTYRFRVQPPEDLEGFSNALYQAVGVELLAGNEVESINNGAFFDALDTEIKAARQSINIVVFIWRAGEPSDRLVASIIERVKDGVDCRILADHVGSLAFEKEVKPTLEQAGCKVFVFRKLQSRLSVARNHRKIFVIDGKVAFTGGVGIFKNWLGDGRHPDEWRESNVRVRGPAVAQMQQAFAENWIEETEAFLPRSEFPELPRAGNIEAGFVTSTSSDHISRAERVTQLMISVAKKRVWIGNAYFLPSPGLLDLLSEKVREGVDVRVMTVSGATDHPEVLMQQRTQYHSLLEAGVRIYEYQPTMFHPKTMLVDDQLSMVGSINFDKLSQDWLEEGSLVIHDRAFAKKLELDWEADTLLCHEILPSKNP